MEMIKSLVGEGRLTKVVMIPLVFLRSERSVDLILVKMLVSDLKIYIFNDQRSISFQHEDNCRFSFKEKN